MFDWVELIKFIVWVYGVFRLGSFFGAERGKREQLQSLVDLGLLNCEETVSEQLKKQSSKSIL